MAPSWSRAENEVITSDYLEMLVAELRRETFLKTDHRRRVAKLLSSRSEKSIEFKHCNISAILIEAGFPFIDGYKPRWNFQHLLREVVLSRLDSEPELERIVEREVTLAPSTPITTNILEALQDPPAPSKRPRGFAGISPRQGNRLRRVDYLAMEAKNRELGSAGEEFVLAFERERLISTGFSSLADRIEHVSRTLGDGLGYDICSFSEDGSQRLIEVKTTRYGDQTPFPVSTNEVRASLEQPQNYFLYRVYNFREQPQLYMRAGAISDSFRLVPSTFRASL